MKRFLLLLIVFLSPLLVIGQEDKPALNMEKARGEMILRPNTRDKEYVMQNNQYGKQIRKRTPVMINKQRKFMRQRMNQIQHHQMMKQRIIQQRKARQQAVRNRQMQGPR